MLTKKEILLIRAALQFWSEEMDLEDSNLLTIYAGDPQQIRNGSRKRFNGCEANS